MTLRVDLMRPGLDLSGIVMLLYPYAHFCATISLVDEKEIASCPKTQSWNHPQSSQKSLQGLH
ncbi:hypothetical protein KTT_19290 [Tengunoibacter tsumagoiensis]|uniref:Uncharacterized protein n=1 Tax=Tengunoibacter tsumagoiensis TaxID=2014871 RepID=A0A401ZYZ9_9CHLR|nr:hypothetical protein KTT_19290 [Tengunoibacter tsumagoiensis]